MNELSLPSNWVLDLQFGQDNLGYSADNDIIGREDEVVLGDLGSDELVGDDEVHLDGLDEQLGWLVGHKRDKATINSTVIHWQSGSARYGRGTFGETWTYLVAQIYRCLLSESLDVLMSETSLSMCLVMEKGILGWILR